MLVSETQEGCILTAVADRKPKAKPADKRARSGASIQAFIDPEVRAAMDSYIEGYNSSHDHKATVTTTIEAALRLFLKSEGHWPPKPRA